MAYKWLLKLDEKYPHLAKRARKMNKRDGFVMKYDPKEVEKRDCEEKKARKERQKKESKEKPQFTPDAKRSKLDRDRVVSP